MVSDKELFVSIGKAELQAQVGTRLVTAEAAEASPEFGVASPHNASRKQIIPEGPSAHHP